MASNVISTSTPSTTIVHITEHVTTTNSVISSASISTSCTTSFVNAAVIPSHSVGTRATRSSTPQGSTVQSSYMKIKVSPGKTVLPDAPAQEAPPPKNVQKTPKVPKVKNTKKTPTAKAETLTDDLIMRINDLEIQLKHQVLYNIVQNDKIKQLEDRTNSLEGELMMINARFSVRDHVIAGLKGEIQRLEQYTRRYSVTISGVEKKKEEKPEELREKVLKLVNEVKSTTNERDIDKLHCNGRIHNGKTQDIILRFKSHAAKEAFYRARKALPASQEGVRIRPALSPNQKKLLYDSQQLLERYQYGEEMVNPPEFVFANLHGDIQVKLKNKFRHSEMVTFNSIKQLTHILREAQGVKETDEEFDTISTILETTRRITKIAKVMMIWGSTYSYRS